MSCGSCMYDSASIKVQLSAIMMSCMIEHLTTLLLLNCQQAAFWPLDWYLLGAVHDSRQMFFWVLPYYLMSFCLHLRCMHGTGAQGNTLPSVTLHCTATQGQAPQRLVPSCWSAMHCKLCPSSQILPKHLCSPAAIARSEHLSSKAFVPVHKSIVANTHVQAYSHAPTLGHAKKERRQKFFAVRHHNGSL